MDKILVVDFGGQYCQLIARRVREMQVYAEIENYGKVSSGSIQEKGYKGIIFTGGPNSVYLPGAPRCGEDVLQAGVPILGICYGDQLLASMCGGTVTSAGDSAEYGMTNWQALDHPLLQGVAERSICWMSHRDFIGTPPVGFRTIGYTEKCPCAAMADDERKLYGVQFHPEVTQTEYGQKILENFVLSICGCSQDWKVEDYASRMIESYRETLYGKKVLLALSGGVDSSVAALILHRAIGEDLTCVFVDNGLLRKDEADYVVKTFRETLGMNLVHVDAGRRFLTRLSGVTEPERKRKIIGEEFIRIFEEEAIKIGSPETLQEHGHADDPVKPGFWEVLAQGTIYPDVIESGKGDAAVIKSHHNVGGLPSDIRFKEIVEPLRDLFKDEVRKVGLSLGLPEKLVFRQPFPGPGLAVRVLGEVTEEKLSILREADAIFREIIDRAPVHERPDQYFAVLTDSRSVGVMGDSRTYGYTVALRAVNTDDFMTASWSHLSYEVMEEAGSRIINEVPGVSRVVYDISTKPPATVEWE